MNLKDLKSKKGPLCLSADVTSSQELLNLADKLGPEISILKTHIDILTDFSPDTIDKLKKIAEKHQFALFEDRKFADIGSTVQKQYAGGLYQIAKWADIVNFHPLPGPGVIEGLMAANPNLKCLAVAEMSSHANLIDKRYTEASLQIAHQFRDHVLGFIAQNQLDPNFFTLTPGIHLDQKQDRMGQRYRTPKEAYASGSDFIIVGRAITHAEDPVKEAKRYKL